MPTSDYTPSVDDVASVIPTRTRDSTGEEVGTFNSDTEPTGTQVQAQIARAVDDMEAEFGPDLPTIDVGGRTIDLRDRVKKVAALRAATFIELTYFPEQVARNVSPYMQMLADFKDSLARLQRQFAGATGGSGDTGGEPGPLPQFGGFGPTEGWDTRRF